MSNGRLTNEERLIVLETEMKGAREDICGIHTKIDKFIEASDRKYATKDELSSIKKLVYWSGGAIIGFLIWSLQEYLKKIGG